MDEKINALLSVVRRYDVRASASPRALFMPKNSEKPGPIYYWIEHISGPKKKITAIDQWFGFRIYCTPDDHPTDPVYQSYMQPGGWWAGVLTNPIQFLPYFPLLQLSRPAVWLASVGWDGLEDVSGFDSLYLRTSTENLDRRLPNQSADIEWAVEKVKWVWERAMPSEPLPRIEIYTTYRDDERAIFEEREREYANSAEAGADIVAYWSGGPGGVGMAKKAEEVFQALQACGVGWHTFDEISKKLGCKASNSHRVGLERCWRLGKIEKGILEDKMPSDGEYLTDIYKVIPRTADRSEMTN